MCTYLVRGVASFACHVRTAARAGLAFVVLCCAVRSVLGYAVIDPHLPDVACFVWCAVYLCRAPAIIVAAAVVGSPLVVSRVFAMQHTIDGRRVQVNSAVVKDKARSVPCLLARRMCCVGLAAKSLALHACGRAFVVALRTCARKCGAGRQRGFGHARVHSQHASSVLTCGRCM